MKQAFFSGDVAEEMTRKRVFPLPESPSAIFSAVVKERESILLELERT